MKIVIQKTDIERVLIKSTPFLETKDSSMVTSNVLISLGDSVMTVNATDYEIGLRSTIQTLGIVTYGECIVDGKKLLDIIKILKNDNVTLEAKNDTLFISQSRSKFKVSLFSDAKFPIFPDLKTNVSIPIDSSVMISAFNKILPCVDTNNPKYEFNGALLDIKRDCVDFVSTDMKRLSIVSVPNESDNEFSIIIPKKAIMEIQKIFYEDVKIYCDSTYLSIESDNFSFFTKLINSKFPEYHRIIPKDINHSVTINKMAMIDSIKQINTVSNEVSITISNNNILFSSVGDANNKADTDIEIDYELNENINIVFNSKFVLDFLSVILEDQFMLNINVENMPFVLESGDLKTIIMPIVT